MWSQTTRDIRSPGLAADMRSRSLTLGLEIVGEVGLKQQAGQTGSDQMSNEHATDYPCERNGFVRPINARASVCCPAVPRLRTS